MLSDLQNIPRIQRGRGWNKGATLLSTWFSRPATAFPTYTAPDTTTIQLDSFVLSFPRAKAVYDQLIKDKIWSNPAGREEITKMLRRKGLLGTSPRSFGNLADPLPLQDPDYINQRPHGNPSIPPADDLTAALANFNFRVVVAGKVSPVSGAKGAPAQYTVQLNEVGVYVWDSFDFEGFQPLGCWSDNPDGFSLQPVREITPVFVGRIPLPVPTAVHTPIFNSHFREWRTANGRGGDYLVFSDLKRIPLSPPETFVIS
jgi:hypothetical protein